MENIQGTKDEFIKLFKELCYGRTYWQVWADLISTMACSLANVADKADVKDAFAIKGKGLIIRVPQNAEEIKAEGAALHHCVGTYVEQVARGQTMILFVRKATEPDKPYYTLEWKNNRVVQCRGSHNKDMTSEVKGFVEVFEKKMLENIEKKVS